MQTNEEYIITNVEVALPKFEGIQGAEDIWRITAEDMQNYEKVFKHSTKKIKDTSLIQICRAS